MEQTEQSESPKRKAVISGLMLNQNSEFEATEAEKRYNRNRTYDQQEAVMQKATAKEIDTLVDSGGIREMRAVVTPMGSYALVVETVGGKELMMYSKTGNVRSFVDVDRLIGWCQRRGFYRIEVYSKQEEQAEPV